MSLVPVPVVSEMSAIMTTINKEILTKLGTLEHLPEFLHDCVNSLSKQNIDFSCNTSNAITWTEEELKKARVQIQNVYCQSPLVLDISLPSDLPEYVRNSLVTVYKIRQKDILHFLLKENLVNNGHTFVENIDWKLKWILGSSNLATIREPVCQVDFRCVSEGKKSTYRRRDVNFECNLAKIDELISVLTNIKLELDEFSNKS